MAPVVIVDSLGCGLWTVTVDSYSGGLSVEWTVDCELWTVTVVDYLWSGLWWTVVGYYLLSVELSLLWTFLVVSYCGLYIDCSYCGGPL